MNNWNESIFSVLSNYSPQPMMNPRENYLTELFAWLINHIDLFGERYVSYLIKTGHIDISTGGTHLEEYESSIEARTQLHVSNGYIDMVIYDNNRKIAFLCEHKIDSMLSEDQIKKYMDNCLELDVGFHYHSVLLTKKESQHTEPADVMIVWREVTQLTRELLKDDNSLLTESDQFILKQFIDYMNMEGLGVSEPINEMDLRSYFTAQEVEKRIDEICRNLVAPDVEWGKMIPGLKTFPEDRADYKPCYNKLKWGRVGIDFFDKWNPGLFAGVILDGTDHKLEPVDWTKGPDLVVLLDVNLRNKEIYNSILNAKWYENLIEQLNKQCDRNHYISTPSCRWKVVDAPKNKWRIVILQTPLLDVIENCKHLDEQKEKVRNCLVEGIRLFVDNAK